MAVGYQAAMSSLTIAAGILAIGRMPRDTDPRNASRTAPSPRAPITLGPGLYGQSRFYASRERFYLFKFCKVWLAAALQATGVPATPAVVITSSQLMTQLRPLAKVTP